jgi:hypothetical protein
MFDALKFHCVVAGIGWSSLSRKRHLHRKPTIHFTAWTSYPFLGTHKSDKLGIIDSQLQVWIHNYAYGVPQWQQMVNGFYGMALVVQENEIKQQKSWPTSN